MEIKEYNKDFEVLNIRADNKEEHYSLNWKYSNGKIIDYIVVFGHEFKDVILDNNERLKNELSNNSSLLLKNTVYSFDSIKCYYLNFNQLIINGGFPIPYFPGYYAIYGCNIDEDKIITIYNGDNESNIHEMNVQIEIQQSNYFLERKTGFFRKKEQCYSGYKKIQVNRGLPGIGTNVIKYKCNNIDFLFDIPQSIIEDANGGIFFIKAAENEIIGFDSNNKRIIIK